MAPANVQHRSIHITDIQQNIEIPEIYNEYPKPEQIKGESKIQNSSDVCCPGLTLYINTKRMVVINTEVTLHITEMHEYEFQKQIFPISLMYVSSYLFCHVSFSILVMLYKQIG